MIVHFAAPRLPEFPGEEKAKAATQAKRGRDRGKSDRQTDAWKDNDQDTQTVTETQKKGDDQLCCTMMKDSAGF